MDFISADLHLGHCNIIKYCSRPFNSVQNMDETIIENINNIVTKHDRFICLGDFAFKQKASYYLTQINCKNVWLIKGNHDKAPSQKDGFKQVIDYLEEKYDIGEKSSKRVCMFHYPILEWNQWYHGAWHLHGHTHGKRSGPLGTHPTEYRLDVGVDCHNFKPLCIDEIYQLMKTVKWEDPFKEWGKEEKIGKGSRHEEIPEPIFVALSELMQVNCINEWWIRPSEGFGNRSAQDMYLLGKENSIWNIINAIRTGQPL